MKKINAYSLSVLIGAFAVLPLSIAKAEMPAAIAAPNETVVTTVHAEGAQVYECVAGSGGKLVWQFREPIATLIADGKTVGRHFAGPSWELTDGSAVTGKVAGRADGRTTSDIPLLKLDATSNRNSGQLAGVTTIQRLNTQGGTLAGSCDRAGSLTSVPYAADYAFLRKID